MTNRHPQARDGDDLFFLWSTSHYDGPLCGICLYKGQKCAFRYVVWEYPRLCAIVPLTEDQYAYEEARQRIFAEMLGPHTYYDYVDGKRKRRPSRTPHVMVPQETISECYRLRGREADLSENEVLAWMEI